MEMLEKVEKLREVADVTYEEAKAALEEANGDILDAMIILEKNGKTTSKKSSSYSTTYETNNEATAIVKVPNQSNAEGDKCKGAKEFGEKIRHLWEKLKINFLVVKKNDTQIIRMPLWLFIAIVIVGIQIVPLLIVISLIFGFHYSFEGADDMKAANDISNKTEEFVDNVVTHVKDEYNKL